MSKKDLENTNPFDYAYKPEQEVTISGFLFGQMQKALMDMMEEERKDFFEEYQDENGLPDIQKTLENTHPKTFYTDRGRFYLRLYLEIMNKHGENIKKGVAVPLEEVRMKKVD
jgi:hypothetical protein